MSKLANAPDPILRSVIQHRLFSIVEEMGEAMLRTSSLKKSRTARVAQGMAPTCTGTCSACAISRPLTSQIAVEKSRLELRIWE